MVLENPQLGVKKATFLTPSPQKNEKKYTKRTVPFVY
ncbi:hypothetical protein SAMN05216463_11347 [Xylanibacter ruminicola]|uniref:Uncharacterized protein n=1 Tax=Xylanibacter ruminicola TaxID=839 RepID=A0A1M6VMV1_XYLRU|nr:hypothetical protein SAMN05216463_11347 [Xylanibacter ruminicola]